MSTRKTHAFLKALPDKHYGSFKTVMMGEKPRNGSAAIEFDDVANRATAYHAMQIRGKASTIDDGSGSHGRALNTVVHGGARAFCRLGGLVQGRGRRGNGGRTSNGNNSSSNSNTSNGRINLNRNSHGCSSARSAHGVRGRGLGNPPSGRSRGRGQDADQTTGDVAGTVIILSIIGGTTAPSAARMRLRVPRNRQMSCRSLLHGSRGSR